MPKASVSSSSSTSTLRRGHRAAKTNHQQLPTISTTNPSSSPASNKRKTQKNSSPPEKRQARFISRPTNKLYDRIDRVFEHRLYLIEKKQSSSFSRDFFILGATGNVYTVCIDVKPSCTCPDFKKGNTCKHILFVMLRVLKLPLNDPRVWQKALLSYEVQGLVGIISSVNETVFANQSVRARFQEIEGKKVVEEETRSCVQRKLEGDCPVCYEPMSEGEEKVVFCRVCGNNVHEDCFMKWSLSKEGSGTVTCIYCRAAWEDSSDGKKKDGDYVNLAAYSDSHRSEDISLEALYPETSRWIHHR